MLVCRCKGSSRDLFGLQALYLPATLGFFLAIVFLDKLRILRKKYKYKRNGRATCKYKLNLNMNISVCQIYSFSISQDKKLCHVRLVSLQIFLPQAGGLAWGGFVGRGLRPFSAPWLFFVPFATSLFNVYQPYFKFAWDWIDATTHQGALINNKLTRQGKKNFLEELYVHFTELHGCERNTNHTIIGASATISCNWSQDGAKKPILLQKPRKIWNFTKIEICEKMQRFQGN